MGLSALGVAAALAWLGEGGWQGLMASLAYRAGFMGKSGRTNGTGFTESGSTVPDPRSHRDSAA